MVLRNILWKQGSKNCRVHASLVASSYEQYFSSALQRLDEISLIRKRPLVHAKQASNYVIWERAKTAKRGPRPSCEAPNYISQELQKT